ncbi:MAG: hypothetical protein E7546_05450 [Ruminococcaceae bacterium]|nr:hypothetical protein [Oscillospiraceae bacterium]
MNCPKCAQPMAEGAVVCPSCFEKTELPAKVQEVCEKTAQETTEQTPEKKKRVVWKVLATAAILLLIAAAAALFLNGILG